MTLGSDVFLFFDKGARAALSSETAASALTTVVDGFFVATNGTTADNFVGTFTFSNTTDATNPNIVQGCYRSPDWPGYLQPVPWWSLFVLVPSFAFFASMNNQQHWWSKQMFVMVLIACVSFTFTRLANTYWGLSNHPDYVSLIGSWFVGVLGNAYSRRFGGTAFTSMLTGILLLVPVRFIRDRDPYILTDVRFRMASQLLVVSLRTTRLLDKTSILRVFSLLSRVSRTSPICRISLTNCLPFRASVIAVIIGIIAGVYSSAALVYFFGKKKNAALVTF